MPLKVPFRESVKPCGKGFGLNGLMAWAVNVNSPEHPTAEKLTNGYGMPTSPSGSEAGAMVGVHAETEMVRSWFATAPWSLIDAVKWKGPMVVGVPLINPDCEMVRPGAGGLGLVLQLGVPTTPLALSCWEYGAPTIPPGNDRVVIFRSARRFAVHARRRIARNTPDRSPVIPKDFPAWNQTRFLYVFLHREA